jgi:hypothetical protein
VDWINLAGDKSQWEVAVNTLMNIWLSYRAVNFVTSSDSSIVSLWISQCVNTRIIDLRKIVSATPWESQYEIFVSIRWVISDTKTCHGHNCPISSHFIDFT